MPMVSAINGTRAKLELGFQRKSGERLTPGKFAHGRKISFTEEMLVDGKFSEKVKNRKQDNVP